MYNDFPRPPTCRRTCTHTHTPILFSFSSWLQIFRGLIFIILKSYEPIWNLHLRFTPFSRMQVGLEGSPLGQWWLDMIGKTLDEGSSFVRVGSRQLAGLLICVWLVFCFSEIRLLFIYCKHQLSYCDNLYLLLKHTPCYLCSFGSL